MQNDGRRGVFDPSCSFHVHGAAFLDDAGGHGPGCREHGGGRLKRLMAVLLVLLFLPSNAGATHAELVFGAGNEGELIRYQIRDITNSSTGGFTSDFQFLKLHTFDLGPGGSIIRVNVQATYAIILASDGEWLFELFVDGKAVEDCHFIFPTVAPGGFLQGDLPVYPSYDVECTIPPTDTALWVDDQVLPVEWRRTALSGNPDIPASSTVSIVFEREDFILTHTDTAFEDLTGATALEFLLFLAVIGLTLLFWSRSKDEVVQVFCALLLFLFSAVAISLRGEWVAWVPFGAVLGVLGGYLLLRSALDWFNEA